MASIAAMSILNTASPTRTRGILPSLVADVLTLMHPCFNSPHRCTNKVKVPFMHMKVINIISSSRKFEIFPRLKNKVVPSDSLQRFPQSCKHNRRTFQCQAMGLLSKSSSENGRWYSEKDRGSGYGGSGMKKRKESNGKKYETSSIVGGNGSSWEDAADNYFSRGGGGTMNENVEVLVGESEIEKKSTMKTSYSTLEDNARVYLSEDSRGGEDDIMIKKVCSGGSRGGLRGRSLSKQSFGGEVDGASNHRFLKGWSKPSVKGKDWSSQESEDDEDTDEENDGEEGKEEFIGDSRWSRIRDRYSGVPNTGDGFDKPDVVRWNRQENWGKKIWMEAHESTLPKIIGEVVHGVGPVLAALTAGRREFYVLYVQEGLELGGSNKKKDKKGVEFQSFLAVESLNVSVATGILLYHLSGNSQSKFTLESTPPIE